MNVEALPYTLLLILAELAIGSLWVTLASDLRGGVTRGFVLTMALCIAAVGGLAYWLAVSLELGADVDGYPIDPSWWGEAKAAMLAVFVASALYAVGVFMGWDPVGRLAAIAGSAAGLAAVAMLSDMLAPPAWGYPAVFLALLAGALVTGAVSTAMVWGHWYLTEGALPAWPLKELSVWLLGSLALQSAVFLVNALVPVRVAPSPSQPVEVGLLGNPAFYFRVGVGLVFPIVLGVLSLQTARIRAMQSATGLLYIAMGAVFAGEVLAKGLMFMTGKPL
ncbi:hypothetical protein HRbin29_00468 [bacterium HR29]|nr:hypothetical protein HRbin29_00468 [bacterium HR29]